jgi:hypothetical protein
VPFAPSKLLILLESLGSNPTLSAKLLIINELLSLLERRRIPLSALVFFFEMSDMQSGAPLENPIKVKTTDSEFIFPSARRDCQTSQLIGRMCSRVNAMDDGRQREECSYVLRTDTTVAV